MSNITNFRTRKNQITKSLKKLMLYLLVISLVLPSLTEVAWAAANPPEVMLRDNQVRAGEAPWKPDNYENGSDAAVMSRTGYCGSVGGARFRGSVKGIHYTEYKNAEDGFGWSRKPGGNDNYADELIRVNAKFDKNTKTIFWNIIVKGQSAGDLMGVTKDLTNPYFIIAISRCLENPKNLYVSNGYRKLKEYPNNWQTLHTGDFRMYDVYKDSDHALYNGRRILGKTDQTKEFLQEKYRLPCTGDNQDKSMAYNIEKYNYYSKYAIIDQQGGLNEANTRMYSFTTELDEGEVAAQGELPNVDSEFTNYMGWGGQRNNVDLSGKVWITVGVTSREARKNTAKPLGTGNYNFSKIAVVDVVPNKDNLGLEPYYNEGSGKAEETVKLPVNLKNSKKFPEGTRFMLESDPKDKFETDHSTGAITQTPAKPNGPISIDQYTGEVTVKIPKGAKGGQEIEDKVHVIYPDGSTRIVPLVVKVIEDKPNIKRGSFATKPKDNEKQLDKVPFEDIYMGDAASKFTYQAGDTSKIIKSFTADGLPSGTTFGVGTQESSNNAPDENGKRFQRSLALKADTKAKVGDFAITFKAVNGSGKETTATNPGVIKTYLPTNNGTKIRIKKGTPEANIPSPEAAIGIYHKKYTNRDDIRNELKTGINKNLIKKDKTGYLPDGTTYTWKNTPKTDVVENNHLYSAYVKYTNKDGKEVVDEVPVYVDVYDTDDVIAYTPNDVTKPTDKKDKNIPKKDSKGDDIDIDDYNIIAFKTEDIKKGKLEQGDLKDKEVISVLVKKGLKWDKVTVPAPKPVDDTVKFLSWDSTLPEKTVEVENGKVYTAKFVKDGQEITPGTKLPDGVFEVKVLRDEASIKENTLYGKSYAVFKDSKLAKDKFPTALEVSDATQYKNPSWNVENPWDQAITTNTDFKASAVSSVFDKDKITKIEVIQDPTKMTYTEGDKPNHDGIKIKLTDKKGNTVEIGKSDLGTYGVTVTPAETTDLTIKDHNNKPFVAKVNGKDGKPLTANSKTNITVNPQQSNEDVIPYVPADKDNPTNPNDTNVPTKDKDGKTVDKTKYDIVAFKVVDADKEKGSLTLRDKTEQQVISVLVKKGSKWEKVTVPTINVADAKKATTKANGYKPSIPATTETVKNGKVYEAQFVTDGQEITPGTKLPDGVFEVKVLRDEASIKENTLYGKSYAVFKDSKLAKDKFPTALEVSDATQYKNPSWNVENPWDQAITTNTDFKASAVSSVFDKDKITKIEVIQDPTKMTYTEGDKPNHDGIKIKLTDKKGNTVEIGKSDLDTYGVTVTPAEDKGLTKTDNGKNFVAKVKDKDGKEISANTRGTITVNDKPEVAKSEKPVITTPKAGDKTISGTGVPGAKVSVTKEDKGGTGQGSPIAQDVLVGNDGKWTAKVPDGVNLEEGDTVLATQKEDGKDESDQAQAKVKGKEDTTADPVIPFEPKDPEKPGDKNDPKIPTVNPKDHKPIKRDEYVVVGFKVEPKDSGTLTLGKQENKAVISALVKKDTAWEGFTMPTPNNANDYVFWHWDTAPAGNVADGQVRVAKFIKSGDEIDPNDNNPLPKDFHKVTVAKETGVAGKEAKDEALFGKTYAVKKGDTLAKDKFPELKVSDSAKFKNPAWDVKDPWTVAVADKDLTFTANAVSAVFDKNNVTKMEVKTQPDLNYVEGNATKGKLDLSKLVVTLTDKNGNTQDVPFSKLGDYGITANPGNGTAMTVAGNNGKPVVLTKDKLTANTENLVVTKDNTTDPVIPFEPKDEDKTKTPIVDPVDDGDTSISGKGEPGSDIIINIPGKDPIKTTVDDGGKWIYPIDPAHVGDVIEVIQIEVGKKPSDPAYVTVGGRSNIVPSHDDGGYWWFGGGSFKPVETEEQMIDKTEHGIHIAYIFGYKDHTFRCEGKITRAEAASMIAHIAKLDLSDNSKPDFKDTPSSWYNAAINAMVKKNLMFADKNGNFRPNEPITRGEFARAIQFIDKENKKEAPFMDIKGHEFEEAINQAYANGRIAGYPDGTFKPDESITRAEAVTILNNFDGRMVRERGIEDVKKDLIKFTDLKPSHWAYYEIIEASNSHAYSRISNDSKEEKWSNLIK